MRTAATFETASLFRARAGTAAVPDNRFGESDSEFECSMCTVRSPEKEISLGNEDLSKQ